MTKKDEEEIYFKVFPESSILEPGAKQEFFIKGVSSHSVKVSETLLCSGMVDKIASPLFEAQVFCKFDNPLLEYPGKISFVWDYNPEKSDKPGLQVSTT